MSSDEPRTLRAVPKTGVIFVMAEARTHGYGQPGASWSNLGQGQPETGPLPGAPPRIHHVEIQELDHEYAPVGGLPELRDAVAQLYNATFRRGLPSQYSAENVAISGGGRAALTRLAAALGRVNLGHFLPDYTAYEEMLDAFSEFCPIPIQLEPRKGYDFSPAELEAEILGKGLSVVLLSNPCNPTGKALPEEELRAWARIASRLDCTLVFDEFYGAYVWDRPEQGGMPPITSAAAHVEDVDRDPVVIVDGLTKGWRYPGWRIAWTVGPKAMIEAMTSAGSFLDGGANRPLQRAALPLLDPERRLSEVRALQAVFREKRARTLEGLERLGVTVPARPGGTFYVWGDLSRLPPPLDDGMALFRAALEHRVILVPGEFFDVNPGRRRPGRVSRFRRYARFSFGPPLAEVDAGLERLGQLLAERS